MMCGQSQLVHRISENQGEASHREHGTGPKKISDGMNLVERRVHTWIRKSTYARLLPDCTWTQRSVSMGTVEIKISEQLKFWSAKSHQIYFLAFLFFYDLCWSLIASVTHSPFS